MTKRSEFDHYLNLTYIPLRDDDVFCLENGRYLKGRKLSQAIEDVSEMTESIHAVNKKVDTRALDNDLDSIIAKLELATIPYKDN